MLTRHGQTLRASYDAVPSKTRLFERFYELLFQRLPETRPLFPADMKLQRERVAIAVSTIVTNAEQSGLLEPMLRDIGARHLNYGVKESHYPVFAQTLLDALAESLGDRWTPDVQTAWTQSISSVCDIMIRGARMAVAPAA